MKGILAHQETPDEWGTSEHSAPEESLDYLALMEIQDLADHQDLKDFPEIRVLLGTQAFQVVLAQEVQPAGMEESESKERGATMESWARGEILEVQDEMEQLVIQGQQDHRVQLDLEDLRV